MKEDILEKLLQEVKNKEIKVKIFGRDGKEIAKPEEINLSNLMINKEEILIKIL